MSIAPDSTTPTTPATRTELMRLPVGAVSPLWGLFAGAAVTGAAWWWMTRWARPENLESMFGQIATSTEVVLETVEAEVVAAPEPVVEPTLVVEAVAEPVVKALEAAPEIVEAIAEPVVEAVEAAPETVEAVVEPAAEAVEAAVDAVAEPVAPVVEALSPEIAPPQEPAKRKAPSKPRSFAVDEG